LTDAWHSVWDFVKILGLRGAREKNECGDDKIKALHSEENNQKSVKKEILGTCERDEKTSAKV